MGNLTGTLGFEQAMVMRIGLALALGLFIGIERERSGKHLGVRTFAFVAIAGALSWQVSVEATMLFLIFTGILAVLINIQHIFKGEALEPTTAVVLMLTGVLGVLVGQGQTIVPVAVGVLTVALLTWKAALVAFSLGVTQTEVRAAVTLALFTFVIFPLLPEGYVDRWNILDLRAAWLTVVLIAAMGFANYVLLRQYGSRGVLYTGVLGGLINSTVTVAELARRTRGDNGLCPRMAFWAILFANSAMLLRNGVLLAIIAPQTLPYVVVPLGAMMAATLAGIILSPVATKSEQAPQLQLSSPFTLKSVLKYALILISMTLLADLARRAAGDSGFYVVSLLGGAVSSASTSASAATLTAAEKLLPHTAAIGTLLASMTSSFIHVPVIWRSGERSGPWQRVAVTTVMVLIAGAAGILVNMMWFQLM